MLHGKFGWNCFSLFVTHKDCDILFAILSMFEVKLNVS